MPVPVHNAGTNGKPADGSQQERVLFPDVPVEGSTFDLDYTKVDQILNKRIHDGDVQYLIKWKDSVKGYTWAKHHPGYIANIVGYEMAQFYLTGDTLLTASSFPGPSADDDNISDVGSSASANEASDPDSESSLSDSDNSVNIDSDFSDDSYVEAQIENHIRNYNHSSRYNRTFEIEGIIGVSVNEEDLTFLVKWKNIAKLDIVPFLIVHRKWPQAVINFYRRRRHLQL